MVNVAEVIFFFLPSTVSSSFTHHIPLTELKQKYGASLSEAETEENEPHTFSFDGTTGKQIPQELDEELETEVEQFLGQLTLAIGPELEDDLSVTYVSFEVL